MSKAKFEMSDTKSKKVCSKWIRSKKEQNWIALTNPGRNLSRSLSSICCDIARNKSTLTSTSGFPRKKQYVGATSK